MEDPQKSLIKDAITDLGQYVDGIPLPPVIKKSLWKAMSDLVSGAADVGIAYLESKSIKIRTEAMGLALITKKATTAAAEKFGSDEQLIDRTINRFGQKLLREQINRESVAAQAAQDLAATPPKDDAKEEISEDWLSMFSRIAEQKSNADVQLFLAKILANEVRKPGSCSPRTIQILSTLSKKEAELFQKFCDCSLSFMQFHGIITNPFSPDGHTSGAANMKSIGLSWENLTVLQDAGLLKQDLQAGITVPPMVFATPDYPFHVGGKAYYMIPTKNTASSNIRFSLILLTTAGRELRSVLHLGTNEQYETKLITWMETLGLKLINSH